MRLDLEKSAGAGSDLPGVPWEQVRQNRKMRELPDVQHGICGQVKKRGIRSEKEKREMKKETFNTWLLVLLIVLYGSNIFPLQAVVTFKRVPAVDYLGKELDGVEMIQATVSYGATLFGYSFEIGRPTQISYFTVPK